MAMRTPYDAWWGTTYTGSGGTQINATAGSFTRRIQVRQWPTVQFQQFARPDIEQAGSRDVATHVPTATMLEFDVWYEYNATTVQPGSEAAQDLNHDIWQDAQALFSPFNGEKFLMWRRQDSSSSNVDRVCLVKPIELPGPGIRTQQEGPGFGMEMDQVGTLVFPVRCVMLYPFFWDATESSSSTLSISGTPGTATVAVDSEAAWKCGARITFSNRSGDITKLLVQNTTHGYEFTIEVGTRFSNGDYFDIRHADKHGNTNPLSTVNASGFRVNDSGSAKAHFWLHPGNNSISITRKAGSGSIDAVVKHQAPFGTV